ncbi:granulin b [Denticeps clupeoides]|uniref:Granulins domain-containing protein n=1 Tax=Denticeps clupeoides TaxID=299321 RepID=A0AAY4DYJ9_9TELE|nr:progranulin-like [Denticeps clupeoides]
MKVWLVAVCLLAVCSALPCPDGGLCGDDETCCPEPSGRYGCCHLRNAVCCTDLLHCCPEGTSCNLTIGQCQKKSVSLPLVWRRPAKHRSPAEYPASVGAVVCPDGESECPDDSTCCQLPDDTWGCCPLAKAVCCDDRRHCCPADTKCDIEHSRCLSATLGDVPLWRKFSAHKRTKKPGSVTCPGGRSSCPDNTTCCLMSGGQYGCCPFPEAVCCSDHLHCCPGNTTCDLEHQMCNSAQSNIPLARKLPALPSNGNSPNDVNCPDQVSSCPDGTTCCELNNGSYGCCPMPKAVCCSDRLHCCPEGTTCDVAHNICVSADGSSYWAAKMSPLALSGKLGMNSVPCNDSVACADGNTCCKTADDEWACCPLPEAVCCLDHVHCCPHGTICNTAAQTCDDPANLLSTTPWVEKAPTFPLTANPFTKCDDSASCPGTYTCCKTASGKWGCCPLSEAVCCDDHRHCCPHGTACNLAASTCDSARGSVPWAEKLSAFPLAPEREKCDEQTLCPSGTTCCMQKSGEWACCPLPNAVCCDDHAHCCPKGYKCDVVQETCNHPDLPSLPWARKEHAQSIHVQNAAPSVNSAVPPERHMCDPHTSCPRDNTCCFMNKVGKWGCCPLPKAECCQDGDHCCPSGFRCDEKHTSCTRGGLEIPWYKKEKAQVLTGSEVRLGGADVKCDSQSSCAAGSTCCKLASGQWGCCPLIKAVCCTDHEHCCPQGYSCNLQSGTCVRPTGQSRPLAVLSTPLEQGGPQLSCDAQSRCFSGQTCCRTSSTSWACCPYQQAVCCQDMKHCCPMGYTCDPKVKGCTRATLLTWDFFSEKSPETE